MIVRAVVVGRGPGADVAYPDEYLSARHAIVRQYDDGRVTIEDLGSTNGVIVNGRRVYDEHELLPGDRVMIGRTLATIPGVM